MFSIPLANTANQNFTIFLDQVFFEITIKYLQGNMGISISANGNLIISNYLLIPLYPIIPSYLKLGNFSLITTEEGIADYNQFGTNQVLIYVTQSEVEALQNAST